VLKPAEIKAINEGKKKVPQMDVFQESRFNFMFGDKKKLNFDFIENEGPKYVMLVDDLVSLAQKHNLFDHSIKPEIKKQLDDFNAEKDEIVQRMTSDLTLVRLSDY